MVSYQTGKSPCDKASLKKVEPPTKYFYFAKAGSWSGWGCKDVDTCQKEAKKYVATGSQSGLISHSLGSFSVRKGSTLRNNAIITVPSENGMCTGLKGVEYSATHSKDVLRTEERRLTYDPFPGANMSECNTHEAKKKNVKRTCQRTVAWEGKRVSDL